jgi:hypothetical protein
MFEYHPMGVTYIGVNEYCLYVVTDYLDETCFCSPSVEYNTPGRKR